MIWNETEACVKFVPIMTAINYILHEKAFVSMQNKKKIIKKYVSGSYSGAVKPKR